MPWAATQMPSATAAALGLDQPHLLENMQGPRRLATLRQPPIARTVAHERCEVDNLPHERTKKRMRHVDRRQDRRVLGSKEIAGAAFAIP